MTNKLETDQNMLRAYALDDAINTLTDEQVCHWAFGNPNTGTCPEALAKRCNLDNWIDAMSTDDEWKVYKKAYEAAMQAGIKVCEDVDFDDDWGENGEEDDTINAAVDAAKEAVAKLTGR